MISGVIYNNNKSKPGVKLMNCLKEWIRLTVTYKKH